MHSMATTASRSRRVLRLPQVISKAGLGRDSIYKGAREGWFPKPIKLTERASGWLEDEVEEFLARRVAQRDSRPAA
jgi:prophage regulatory protein